MAKTLSKYRKTINELEAVASKFWPSELSELEAKLSIIPLLVSTQDIFIAVIGTGAKTLNGLFSIVEQSELPANLFLKHLSILADYGGEMLQRVSREFGNLFPDGQLNFIWGGKPQQYAFLSLPKRKLNSKALRIDGKEILKDHPLSDLQKDAIALLMFGSRHVNSLGKTHPQLATFRFGQCIGNSQLMTQIVKQRYLVFNQALQSEEPSLKSQLKIA